MKGMQKISRGSSFSGVMAYAFDGDVDNPRELEGEVIGGNMSGRDPKSLAREFDASRAVRPDVAKPVWHNSLRLLEGEKLTKEQWSEIGDAYMKKMGFSENHQRVYVLHDDKAGQHIHIVASRIGLDGKLFLGKNENLISTKKIAELEREFGLTITKGPTYDDQGKVVMPDRSRPKAGEVGKFERTGESPNRFVLADLIDQAIMDKPTASVFAERLVLSGVEVRANFSKDKLNGFSFVINGVPFKGSQLGKQYSGKALFERGLSYEQDRDYAQLKQYSSAAKGDADRDRAAGDPTALESSRDRASHGPGTADSGSVRGSDGPGVDHREQGAARTNSAGHGRDGRAQDDLVESRTADGDVDSGNDQSPTGTGIDPEATNGRENSAENLAGPGSSGLSSHQSADAGGGFDSGVDVSSIGSMHTGDEATDNLLKLAHKAMTKEAQEAMARQKRGQAEYEAVNKKRMAEVQTFVNQLLGISTRSADPTARNREVVQFSRAVGIQNFDVVFSDPTKKRALIRKSLTAAQLEDPRTVRGLASHFTRKGDVLIRPADSDSAGVVVLQGLTDADIKKLEAIGFPAAAVVGFAGKHQAWIKTGEKLTLEERQGLVQRLSEITDVLQKPEAYGRLPGFSKGFNTVEIMSATGQASPALKETLQEIRADIQDRKISVRLEQAVVARSKLDVDSYQSIGGIKTLKNGWFREARDGVQADVMDRNVQISNDRIEAKVIEAMARQKVPVSQAYEAVFRESRVSAGSELYAAETVSQSYTRVALEKQGKPLAGIDLETEARQRFPEIIKRAESRVDSSLKAMDEQMKIDAQEEQRELERYAKEQRLAKALDAAMKVAQQQKEGLTKG